MAHLRVALNHNVCLDLSPPYFVYVVLSPKSNHATGLCQGLATALSLCLLLLGKRQMTRQPANAPEHAPSITAFYPPPLPTSDTEMASNHRHRQITAIHLQPPEQYAVAAVVKSDHDEPTSNSETVA